MGAQPQPDPIEQGGSFAFLKWLWYKIKGGK